MPYDNISQLPEYVKKYSVKLQRQWFYVFNSTWNKLTNDKVLKSDKEKRCFQAANSVLKKRFNKKNTYEKNTREDYFLNLVDQFIGNLNG